jgi:hypothetical protein
MPCPCLRPWPVDHSNYTWLLVQFMKLLIMLFSSTFRHFIPLRPKYSQHPVIKRPQYVCSSLNARHYVWHPYRITANIMAPYILMFTFLDSWLEERNIWSNVSHFHPVAEAQLFCGGSWYLITFTPRKPRAHFRDPLKVPCVCRASLTHQFRLSVFCFKHISVNGQNVRSMPQACYLCCSRYERSQRSHS